MRSGRPQLRQCKDSPFLLGRNRCSRQRCQPGSGSHVRLEAKPGKEATLKAFLESALPLARSETLTPIWFALQFSPSSFGIFDVFYEETGREAHLGGAIAAALMSKAAELLAVPPTIEKVDLLAVKLPG